MKSPIRNTLAGDLTEELLIQGQKLKVDMETVFLTMDQLLQANEINFQVSVCVCVCVCVCVVLCVCYVLCVCVCFGFSSTCHSAPLSLPLF